MKTLTYIPYILFIALFSCGTKDAPKLDNQEVAAPSLDEPDSVLRHVVMFKFNDEVSKAGVDSLNTAFADLQNSIEQIKGFEWGVNSSPEGLADSLTHCYVVTFHSAEDRDMYLPHPAHKEFVNTHGPKIQKVVVVDYWTR